MLARRELRRLAHAAIGRPARAVLGALAGAVLACLPATSTAAGPSEYQVKAAFIYNFARFVDWPARVRSQPTSLTICVLGDSPLGPEILALAGKPVGQATLQVRRVAIEQMSGCQVLFVSSSEGGRLDRVFAQTRGAAALTIGDTPGFAERGVLINFYLEQSKVRFEINIDAVQRSGLTISSHLLRLARITHDKAGASD